MDALLPSLLKKGAADGLGGLLGKFTSAGFGSKANSWVGTGDNDPLGADEVHRIAAHAGASRDDVKSGLAEMIPRLVDKMSPGGSLPTGDLSDAMKGIDFTSILRR